MSKCAICTMYRDSMYAGDPPANCLLLFFCGPSLQLDRQPTAGSASSTPPAPGPRGAPVASSCACLRLRLCVLARVRIVRLLLQLLLLLVPLVHLLLSHPFKQFVCRIS
jgi:hypothetical protein